VTITYDYDPLYRLTDVHYSIGDYYHYTYDAVGNRLEQTSMVSGLSSTVEYVYDDANRLTTSNGVTYTWDANGNLLSDGIKTYTYDSANRLKAVSGQQLAIGYGYNGLGDRLQETLNGQTTTFTMDFNTGLTQALSDGTNTYIYGNGRIAQAEGAGTEYFLGDALGSVRQLTNNSGAITYASAYDPYGVTAQSYGASGTAYGYTNEYTSQGLTYLRSRFYSPSTGRFITRDSWPGNYYKPLSLNRWMYVEGNPVNRTDPSGLCWYPNLQTGGTLFDHSIPNPNLCPWFIEAFKQHIPESERAQFLSSHSAPTYIGSTTGESRPLWQIVYYGKSPAFTPYRETPTLLPLHQDTERMVLVYGIPVVVGAGGGVAKRCESGVGCYDVTQAYAHGGPGIDILNGIVQLHFGLQVGDDTGPYLEGELLGQSCGIKISLPDMGFYSPWGDIGVTAKTYKSHWILTTEKAVYEYGGYSSFGNQFIKEGFSSYYVYDEDFNRSALLARWVAKMSRNYNLEERP